MFYIFNFLRVSGKLHGNPEYILYLCTIVSGIASLETQVHWKFSKCNLVSVPTKKCSRRKIYKVGFYYYYFNTGQKLSDHMVGLEALRCLRHLGFFYLSTPVSLVFWLGPYVCHLVPQNGCQSSQHHVLHTNILKIRIKSGAS